MHALPRQGSAAGRGDCAANGGRRLGMDVRGLGEQPNTNEQTENEREPRFAHGSVRGDEKGDCVGAAIISGSLNLGVGAYEGELVLPRTGSAGGRL